MACGILASVLYLYRSSSHQLGRFPRLSTTFVPPVEGYEIGSSGCADSTDRFFRVACSAGASLSNIPTG